MMGQHKTNPTAILAKEGLIKPKERPMGKAQYNRMIEEEMYKMMYKYNFFSSWPRGLY